MGYRLKDLDAQWLLKKFFFGIYKTRDDGTVYLENPTDTTEVMPEVILEDAIDEAITDLEGKLDAAICAQEGIEEYHPLERDLAERYFYTRLYKIPVASVASFKLTWGEGGGDIWTAPENTIQKGSEKEGVVRVLPYRALGFGGVDPGAYLFAMGSFDDTWAPSMIKVTYTAGMDAFDRDLDSDIVKAIGLIAAAQPFNILGDIVIGAGIASISTSIDGLSQSVNTTASAENSAFSARILAHQKELLGDPRTPGMLQTLQAKWRRIPVATF